MPSRSVVGSLPSPSTRKPSRTRLATTPQRLKSSCVAFSRPIFAAWWVALSIVHVAVLAYHARITNFYWRLPGSPIGEMIELYDLSIPQCYSRVVALVNASIASIHVVAVLRMVWNSIRARQLVFLVDRTDTRRTIGVVIAERRSARLWAAATRLFAYKGPLGVEGKHFDLVLCVAEFVETLLQTYQASRLSALVARRALSRVYVGVLVFNCWCVPFIHCRYHRHIPERRLLSLMCDALLDLVSSVGVPGVLFAVYHRDYDPLTHSITRTRWYDDHWLVQLWSEHELIVIVSWIDAVSQFVFAVGLLLSLEGIKQLMRAEAERGLPKRTLIKRLSIRLLRLIDTPTIPKRAQSTGPTRRRFASVFSRARIGSVFHRLKCVHWSVIFHIALTLWGAVVLGIHLTSELRHSATPPLASCPVRFHEWLARAPVCLIINVNCNTLAIDGRAEEIEKQWSAAEPSSVRRLVVRHCSTLEMPPSVRQFRSLKAIKLYNSTVTTWDANVILSEQDLPALRSLQFIRVNFSGAVLPPGLSNISQRIRIIELVGTNLHDLPTNLDETWPSGLRLSLDASAFTRFPSVLSHLLPWQLSLSGNPLAEIPRELFLNPGICRLGLAHLPATQWPSNLSDPSRTLRQVSFVDTPIHDVALPVWMDAVIQRAQAQPFLVVALYAGGSPYCARQESLSDEPLDRCVSCLANDDDVSYPLAFEDSQSR